VAGRTGDAVFGRAGSVPGDVEAERMIRKSGYRFSEEIMRK
jgi:hypothetical protein